MQCRQVDVWELGGERGEGAADGAAAGFTREEVGLELGEEEPVADDEGGKYLSINLAGGSGSVKGSMNLEDLHPLGVVDDSINHGFLKVCVVSEETAESILFLDSVLEIVSDIYIGCTYLYL